ncbi:PREDICTED: folliculin-interacting protein 2 [Ceratosolen solmsi marchali]|uniref:Folliculin-interacting protein 2 n=1 Tax=Ceratosolen solmsi marchali TaxID=326594 RepID=A0AAJ6YLH6_9HYME|nr:PREDICTED: folliculin-interacting protein 2 [Ceratosolen solmsi marchali]
MPLIARLWAKGRAETALDERRTRTHGSNSLQYEQNCVRILLFRECEWRGRKLLFDSIAIEKNKEHKPEDNDNNNTSSYCRNIIKNKRILCERDKRFVEASDGVSGEERWLCQDISLLSEMIFGSVAMTYRGVSFKIHEMNPPGCIMYTKVFPYLEHGLCKQSLIIKNSDGYSNGNHSGLTTNEGSQSADGAGNSSGAAGSLSSLRRRWLRAESTSLSRFETDDSFRQNCKSPTTNSVKESHAPKHKTRLGLAMVLQLPNGREQETSKRLLEHAALLEGMLDRLRLSCIEGKDLERNFVNKLYRTSSRCVLKLLGLLMSLDAHTSATLIWHDLLLNSSMTVNVQVNTLHRSLEQMFLLLEELDSKSTNFFISTIVTAVLTHHLGWVHTAPPRRSKQPMESLSLDKQYACSPLWAQLNDLYGALGTPARVAQTVIAGEPGKAKLIASVLRFLSYFLRSGVVERREESRCRSEEDVHEAVAILERADRKNACPDLGRRWKKSTTLAESTQPIPKSETKLDQPRKRFEFEAADDDCIDKMFEMTSAKKLKSSAVVEEELGEERTATREPKLIPREDEEREVHKESVLRGFLAKKKVAVNEITNDAIIDQKLAALRRPKLTLDNFHSDSKTLEDPSLALLSSLGEDTAAHETKAQVYFALGNDTKSGLTIRERLRSTCKCQCSYTFTRVPSTSAELPEGVLRKIIQRNFPESSKNMQPSADCTDDFGLCLKCHRGYASSSHGFENGKLLLETPTNATEMLRGCRGSASSRVLNSNCLEALIEASCVIELPMPRSKKVSGLTKKMSSERVGFSKSLLSSKTVDSEEDSRDSSYTWGMVVQGFTKRKEKSRRKTEEECRKEWWWPIREGLGVEAKFPIVDHPVSEALCILGDLDNWQVGLLSNSAGGSTPIPVGMSRLVSNMLEAFACMWKEFRSPVQCIKLLESRLREMWMRSETLAEFLLAADTSESSYTNLTSFLDVDAADLPLLLAVATTHTPQIAQRLGLTLA